jgi:hypothetical protein
MGLSYCSTVLRSPIFESNQFSSLVSRVQYVRRSVWLGVTVELGSNLWRGRVLRVRRGSRLVSEFVPSHDTPWSSEKPDSRTLPAVRRSAATRRSMETYARDTCTVNK